MSTNLFSNCVKCNSIASSKDLVCRTCGARLPWAGDDSFHTKPPAPVVDDFISFDDPAPAPALPLIPYAVPDEPPSQNQAPTVTPATGCVGYGCAATAGVPLVLGALFVIFCFVMMIWTLFGG